MPRSSASMPQSRDLVDVDVEAGLVELDDVGAGVGQLARLGVEQLGEAHGEVGSSLP